MSASETSRENVSVADDDWFSFDPAADFRSADGQTEVTHKDGIPWFRAPVPPRKHECWAQTSGWMNWVNLVERCPCGAIRLDGRHGAWLERNRRLTDGEPVGHDLTQKREASLIKRLLATVSGR